MSLFHGLEKPSEGLESQAERNAWRRSKGSPLYAQVSGLRHLLAHRGLGTLPTTATQTATTLKGRGLYPREVCSSGLKSEAKLALDTNPLNNFQLLSKSIGLLNHESLS